MTLWIIGSNPVEEYGTHEKGSGAISIS